MYLFQQLIAYPVSRSLGLVIKLSKFLFPKLGRFEFQVPKRKYKLIRKTDVIESHYLWVTLMWTCREKADAEERSRISHLDDIYHGLGATYIAMLLAWLFFYLVHEHLPTQVAVIDKEIPKLTFAVVAILFFVFWQNRKDVSRHQLVQLNQLYHRKKTRQQSISVRNKKLGGTSPNSSSNDAPSFDKRL